MTALDIIMMYDKHPWYCKIIGLHMVLMLEVNTMPEIYYNIRLVKAYKKWLFFKIKEYKPNE